MSRRAVRRRRGLHPGTGSHSRSHSRSRARSRPQWRAHLRLHGGLLTGLLALPARLGVRRPVIAAVVLAAGGLYLHALLTAPPMPPGQLPAPAGGRIQATDAVHPVR